MMSTISGNSTSNTDPRHISMKNGSATVDGKLLIVSTLLQFADGDVADRSSLAKKLPRPPLLRFSALQAHDKRARRRRVGCRNPDALGLGEFPDGLDAVFPAKP